MHVHTCICHSHLPFAIWARACLPRQLQPLLSITPGYRCGRRPPDYPRKSAAASRRLAPRCIENIWCCWSTSTASRWVRRTFRGVVGPTGQLTTCSGPCSSSLPCSSRMCSTWTQGTRSSLPKFRSLPCDVILAGVASCTAIMDKYAQRYPGIKFISVALCRPCVNLTVQQPNLAPPTSECTRQLS
jgi:hypothetical protein